MVWTKLLPSSKESCFANVTCQQLCTHTCMDASENPFGSLISEKFLYLTNSILKQEMSFIMLINLSIAVLLAFGCEGESVMKKGIMGGGLERN